MLRHATPLPLDAAAETPVASPADLVAAIGQLRRAGARLAARPTESVLGSLAAVVEEWLHPDSPYRQLAEQVLPPATGFSPQMVRHGLPLLLEPLRAPALAELLDAELGDRRSLDQARRRPWVRGPAVAVHILPSNLPGLAAAPVALTLAVKGAVLVKAGHGDRVFPALWARSIAAIDDELGACVAAFYWPGGERCCEDVVMASADLVVMSGSDAATEDARKRCSGRFIGHGHKVSFAVVAREVAAHGATARGAARSLALDVCVWDQRGCLSPQMCFVEGDFDTACQFGAAVAEELEVLASRLPPARTTVAERAAVRGFRDAAEWRRLGGAPDVVFAAPGLANGTVVVEAQAVFRPTPLCRSLRVLPLRRASDLAAALAPARPVLEGAGVAAPVDRWAEYTALLGSAGVHRVCRLGEMQRAPLSWRQGGRPRVADWVQWSCDAR